MALADPQLRQLRGEASHHTVPLTLGEAIYDVDFFGQRREEFRDFLDRVLQIVVHCDDQVVLRGADPHRMALCWPKLRFMRIPRTRESARANAAISDQEPSPPLSST